jgi:nucleoid DNA-binding protein
MAERIEKKEFIRRLAERMQTDEATAARWLDGVLEEMYQYVHTHVGEDVQIFRGLEMTKISAEEPNVPRKLRERFEAITGITDEFCHEHLNDEYAALSREMAAVLCEEKPSPLESGRARSWAAGIVYALGRVNFLSDKNLEPHMTMSEFCEKIGVSQGNASSKSRELWSQLGLIQMDPDWCLPSMLEGNPLAWIVEVDGLPVDVRMLPREVQEEAYRLGLIPYMP